MSSQVSNLFLPKLPCTRLQSVIGMMFVLYVPVLPASCSRALTRFHQGTSPSPRGICNVYRQEFNWLYTAPEGGGQLKTQQPSKAASTSAQKRAISFGHRTKRSGHEKISKRHIRFMIIIIHLHKKHMDINCCTLSLICLWNMNYLGKRGLISNRALTWNV